MNIKDLAGKTVLKGLGPFDLDNDREDWCIEFTDGTRVYFSPNAYSTHTTDCEVYPPSIPPCVTGAASDMPCQEGRP
jgi:hypothetical protein